MYNQTLRRDIQRATELIEHTMSQMTPALAPSVGGWMRTLSGSPNPADYFVHPEAFPMFLLPYWVEKATGVHPVRQFRRDLVYSTVNGYYYIRLMDNVMDGDGNEDLSILPAMHVFLLECIRPYTIYFSPEHAFWKIMRETWFRSAEAATHDALLHDINSSQFVDVAARKICAVEIPIAGVCHYYGRPDLIHSWTELARTLGCWHQMLNDLFDWRKDLAHQNYTYFLSEARRRMRAGETIAEWVIRTGFHWGIEFLDDIMQRLDVMAAQLHSSGLRAYLRERRALLAKRVTEITAPLRAMQHLVTAMHSNPSIE